uniref:NADH-ubiquinone oxidoreductase chain 2 n=1 Tax=Stenacron interpunctatum TaxID=248191 RepID=A0A8F6U6H4_9INSE|nr:NADH dehydrogenase subunit 2 [Stenacron interpunctatum]
MLFHPTRLLFYCTLVIGTLITISSSTWLGAWIGLEINLLSFIPLMSNKNNQFSTEAALKYFLTQALASALLLFGVLCLGVFNQLPFAIPSTMSINSVIMATLLLKMGAAPFHFWFPGVMEGLSWTNGLILMTWQKIGPFILISYILSGGLISTLLILISSLVGALGGFNQTSLRQIMAYSSINHLGWMLAATLLGENYWLIYFGFYTFLSLAIISLFNSYQLSHINQVFGLPISNPILKLALFCNLLSLGGLPPFLGFLPKWVIIQGMVNEGYYFLITALVLMALITLYFYIRIGYSAFMLAHSEAKWLLSPYYTSSGQLLVLSSLTVSLLGLLLCTLVMSVS